MAEFLPFPRDFAIVTGSKRVVKGSVYDITGEVADDDQLEGAVGQAIIKPYLDAPESRTVFAPLMFSGSSFSFELSPDDTREMEPYPHEFSVVMNVDNSDWVIMYGRVLVTAVPLGE